MRRTEIGRSASELTRAKFADELSSHVGLTKTEISDLFPTKGDREELAKLVDIVLNSANENQRKAKLINNVSSVAGAAVKMLKKAGLGV